MGGVRGRPPFEAADSAVESFPAAKETEVFTSLDVSLVRERNAGLLWEVKAERLGQRLRADRGRQPGWRRTVSTLMARGFATPPLRLGRDGRKGVRLKDA